MLVTVAWTGLRWGEVIGLEREFLHPGEIHVEWQLRELGRRFHRLPPKDDSYRSPAWEPCVPVDLPPFLEELLARQVREHPYGRCACQPVHGGSGLYVFRSPDSRHYRRSNYGRRVFRPACDGRMDAVKDRPGRLVIADATSWPGTPLAFWPPPRPDVPFTPPQGRGIQAIPEGTPLSCWLPLKPGLTMHGPRHGHKTWCAEDSIPEILSEQRLGHEVPGMRGLYAHASERMREQLKAALQVRWEDSLCERAAISPRSPVPLLDALLAAIADQPSAGATVRVLPTRGDTASQIPPKMGEGPIRGVG
jgi:hypothetical protein